MMTEWIYFCPKLWAQWEKWKSHSSLLSFTSSCHNCTRGNTGHLDPDNPSVLVLFVHCSSAGRSLQISTAQTCWATPRCTVQPIEARSNAPSSCWRVEPRPTSRTRTVRGTSQNKWILYGKKLEHLCYTLEEITQQCTIFWQLKVAGATPTECFIKVDKESSEKCHTFSSLLKDPFFKASSHLHLKHRSRGKRLWEFEPTMRKTYQTPGISSHEPPRFWNTNIFISTLSLNIFLLVNSSPK